MLFITNNVKRYKTLVVSRLIFIITMLVFLIRSPFSYSTSIGKIGQPLFFFVIIAPRPPVLSRNSPHFVPREMWWSMNVFVHLVVLGWLYNNACVLGRCDTRYVQ